jgi:ribonuclease R
MFVELENTVEGLVRLSTLEDDYYIFNEKTYSLVGERTRKVYRIGDVVNVLVARADVLSRQIDFMLVSDEDGEEHKGIYLDDSREIHKKKKRDRKGDKVPGKVKAHIKSKNRKSKNKKPEA